jgi:hypothetical protein
MLKIPGRTAEEKALDFSIICLLSMTWLGYHPADKGTWQDSRWMETLYYRKKWQILCEYS